MKKMTALLLCLITIFGTLSCQKNDDPYAHLSDEEKLVAVGTWEKLYDPYTTIAFGEDKKGSEIVNGAGYEFSWELNDNTLTLVMDDTETIEYSFESVDKGFILTNTQKGTGAKFVYGSSQPTELPETGTLPEELIGNWSARDEKVYSIVFDKNGTGYRYKTEIIKKKSVTTKVNEFSWKYSESDHTLYIKLTEGGKLNSFEYITESDSLILVELASSKEYGYTYVSEEN